MRSVDASGRFWDLIDRDAAVEVLGSGFRFTEGPIWYSPGAHLLFSDIHGDVRRRWDRSGVTEVKRPNNKGNGMTYDADGNLIVCEHVTSQLVRENPDGTRGVVASHFEGNELNSPNDVCVRSDGSIYFTDPWYGRMPIHGLERPRPLGWQGVFRVPPGGGEPELLVARDEFDQPNGLCFSPDESLLYVDDTGPGVVRVYRVADDGSLVEGRVFADGLRRADIPGVADGMKCDELGNVWVTGPGGVHVFDPDGVLLGVLEVDEVVANLTWGGPDWRTLFLTASTTVRAVPVRVGPRREPYMGLR
jgi:gluconolactonase